MKKGGILLVFLFTIMSINFVSAAFHYGGISTFFDAIGSENLILALIFGISGLILSFSLKKYFGGMGGILAVLIALGVTAGAHFSGIAYSFERFFYTLGFSEEILYTIVPLLLIIGLIYISYSKEERKFKFYKAFFVSGALLIAISFTEIIYEKDITFILGLILLIIGIWLWKRKKKDYLVSSNRDYYDNSYRPSKRQIYKQQIAQQKLAERGQRRQKKVIIQKQQQVQQKQRTQREFQGKYNQYRYAAEAIVKQVGHIPKKGTSEYKQWTNYTNAVKTIEKMASRQGFRLR